jgi:hypothetical protein
LSHIPIFSGGNTISSIFHVSTQTPTRTIWTLAVWTVTPVSIGINTFKTKRISYRKMTSGAENQIAAYLLRWGETRRFAESVLLETGDFLRRSGDLNWGER